MRTFLNVPILDINCTCRMLAHRNFVIPFTKIPMFSFSELFKDIQLNGASVGDDLNAK